MHKIKLAEDFGLVFNCMTRLYMNGYDEEILEDMSEEEVVSLFEETFDYPLPIPSSWCKSSY